MRYAVDFQPGNVDSRAITWYIIINVLKLKWKFQLYPHSTAAAANSCYVPVDFHSAIYCCGCRSTPFSVCRDIDPFYSLGALFQRPKYESNFESFGPPTREVQPRFNGSKRLKATLRGDTIFALFFVLIYFIFLPGPTCIVVFSYPVPGTVAFRVLYVSIHSFLLLFFFGLRQSGITEFLRISRG